MKEIPAKLFNERVGILDGFRGLAILLVIAYHYTGFFSFGWIGVDLFFVLSGFLITGKLLESAGRKDYFSSFYLKRILRIVPLYFLVLLFFFVLIPAFFHSVVTPSYAALLKQQGYYWTFTLNFYEAIHGWPDNITLVPLWSLACEMQFYLTWPFIIFFIYRQKKEYLLAILFAFILFAVLFRLNGHYFGYTSDEYRYILLPSRIDAFTCGALLCVCIKKDWFRQILQKGWVLSLVSLVAAVIIMICQHHLWHFGATLISGFGYTLNALFWSGIFASVWFAGTTVVRLFSFKGLTIAGKYSYAIYIFHVPVKVVLIKLFKDTWLPGYVIILLAVIVTLGCSVISYHLIEKRFLYLKDNLEK
jgi:peptidoglycan/LPS O-acetylase OafA/YrhL